jgi:hypothetical protein
MLTGAAGAAAAVLYCRSAVAASPIQSCSDCDTSRSQYNYDAHAHKCGSSSSVICGVSVFCALQQCYMQRFSVLCVCVGGGVLRQVTAVVAAAVIYYLIPARR